MLHFCFVAKAQKNRSKETFAPAVIALVLALQWWSEGHLLVKPFQPHSESEREGPQAPRDALALVLPL